MTVPLRNELVAFVRSLTPELDEQLSDDMSLIKSGVLDSMALFQLAEWIDEHIGVQGEINLDLEDLRDQWDTIANILKFIERHRQSSGA